jgi:two-component system OmpR family response regulator
MSPSNAPAANRFDYVYALTDAGEAQLSKPGGELSSFQQELLLRVNGRKTRADLAADMGHASGQDVEEMLDKFQRRGWVLRTSVRAPEDTSLDFTALFAGKSAPSILSEAQRERLRQESQSGATQLARRGYYVSIARSSTGRIAPRSGDRHSVLLIEDDPDIARLVKMLLESEGFAVRVAGDRAAIVAALSRMPLPDLVLLDVMLPDADGFDVLRKIRAHPILAGLRVIMLTAKADRDDVMHGLEGGADGYVTKPFDLDRLVEGVNAVLGKE